MTIVMPARRREAEDLQALLEGRRASSRASTTGARDLAQLAGLARALSPVEHRPRPEFRAELRARLLAEVAAPSVPAAAPSARPAAPALERPSGRTRFRQAVAAVAVTAVVAGAGAAAASTRALPGDPLYGLKRGIEDVQMALARGDVGHGRELLEQADARLGEAERLAAAADARSADSEARIARLLGEVDADDAAAAEHLTDAYRDTGDPEPIELLDRTVTDQQSRLADLLPLLEPSLRDQVRLLLSRLAAIGEQTAGVLGGNARAIGESRPAGRDAGGPGPGDPVDAARSALAGSTGAGTSGGAAALGPVGGALDSVGDAAGAATGSGTGSGGGTGGGSGGGSTGVGGVVGGVLGGVTGSTTSSTPTTAAVPLPTVSASVEATVPLPLPSSSPLVTDPVGTVTSAVPLPTSSALPSVSACVAVPPLTSC